MTCLLGVVPMSVSEMQSLRHVSVSVCVCVSQETATTCRERCGGQGYLSCNRFGAILGFSHAGMTAEGDNRYCPCNPKPPGSAQPVLCLEVVRQTSDTLHTCGFFHCDSVLNRSPTPPNKTKTKA